MGKIPLPAGRKEVMLFSGLDLSTQSPSFGAFYKGYFYDSREDIASDYADLGRTLRENAAKIGLVLGFDPDKAYGDGINAVNGKTWRNYLPGHFAFDAEAAMMAGGKAITFSSTDDARELTDTPEDTWGHVNVANLLNQTRLLACEYWDLLNDTNDPAKVPADSAKGIMPIADWPAWTREGLRLGYCTLDGRDLLFDPKANFVPDHAVQGSLAVIANPSKTMVGVRGNLIQLTDSAYPDPQNKRARFKFVGLPLVISSDPSTNPGFKFAPSWNMHLAAYHLKDNDPTDKDDSPVSRGDIDYAPDLGVNGAETYPLEFSLSGEAKTTQVIEFPCVATSIYDLIDQQALKALTGVRIFDGATDSDPRQFGYVLAGNEPGVSYVEDVAVLFTSSREKTRLKVVMDSGPGATRFLLINSQPPNPKLTNVQNEKRAEGAGYTVGVSDSGDDSPVQNGAITETALRVAQDMWNLDEFRLRMLAKYRIVNDVLMNDKHTGLHDIAKQYLDEARAALAAKDYDLFDTDSRKAWAYEARVYPQAQATANDVVQGVIFYLFLLIPFAYFLERLLIASRDLNRQLGWTFLIFMVIFLIFTQIHPAFDITINPIIVLIAFVMLALSVFVSAIVWGKFEEQIKAFRRTVSGVHKADVGKASIAFAAFTLGISNMRRRKERTLLTCITLILLTFTVLSFTSVVSGIRYNDRPADGTAIYNGILLHNPDWSALQEPAFRLLNDEYGHQFAVAPRVWYTGAPQGQTSYLQVSRAQAALNLKGVVGLSSQEANVTKADGALVAGRWFNSSDTYSTILPKSIADQLGVSASDVGKATVDFSGVPYMVIGIVDPDKLMGIKDLDSEPITPVDFTSAQNQNSASQAKSSYQQFTHIDAGSVMFVPYSTLIDMGGDLRSVAINFGSKAVVDDQLKKLMPRLDMNLYAGMNGTIHRFSAIQATESSGLATIIIPILIASLIVLNTMLGSVFERVKEIKTFSSVGLAPSNIAMLFIAEALVYAIIGAVSGYLIGQALSKVISTFHILPGLNLNFSSTSAEISIGVVIGVVLLSTIFPARKASQVATPSLDSTWKVPEPDGDTWTIMLPFAVTGSQVRGINAFLTEWFRSYEEQSVGDFLTQGVTSSTYEAELGTAYRLSGRVWLAPFDLGVSEDFTLNTKPTELEGVFEVELVIVRVSGDVSNWKRINRRFLNVTRKQFLIWRTLTAEERERYLDEAGVPEGGATTEVAGSGAVAPAL
jgi:ABC-type antimicrobial peptide transport system permease subunit